MKYIARAYYMDASAVLLSPDYRAGCIKIITTRWHWRARLFKFTWDTCPNIGGITWATIEARDETGMPEELL